jgi:hypothetical protein
MIIVVISIIIIILKIIIIVTIILIILIKPEGPRPLARRSHHGRKPQSCPCVCRGKSNEPAWGSRPGCGWGSGRCTSRPGACTSPPPANTPQPRLKQRHSRHHPRAHITGPSQTKGQQTPRKRLTPPPGGVKRGEYQTPRAPTQSPHRAEPNKMTQTLPKLQPISGTRTSLVDYEDLRPETAPQRPELSWSPSSKPPHRLQLGALELRPGQLQLHPLHHKSRSALRR